MERNCSSSIMERHFAQPARDTEASVLTLADPFVLTTAQSVYKTTVRIPGLPTHPGPTAAPTETLLSHHLLPPIPFLRQFSLPHGRPCSLIGEQVGAALSLPDGNRHQPRPWLQPGWLSVPRSPKSCCSHFPEVHPCLSSSPLPSCRLCA